MRCEKQFGDLRRMFWLERSLGSWSWRDRIDTVERVKVAKWGIVTIMIKMETDRGIKMNLGAKNNDE